VPSIPRPPVPSLHPASPEPSTRPAFNPLDHWEPDPR
jgi:hypothetical protein